MDSQVARRAKFIRLPEPTGVPRVAMVLRDSHNGPPPGRCSFKMRGRVFQVPAESLTVAVIVVMLQLRVEAAEQLYVAWIDELAPSGVDVLESLAQQMDLSIWFAPPELQAAVSTVIPNVLRTFASRHLDLVREIAESSPWDVRRFATARSLLENQYPDANSLWNSLKADG